MGNDRGAAIPRRILVYAVLLTLTTISYGDRAILSVAMLDIAREFKLTPYLVGWLLSSFLWSYFLFNLPAALLVDRYGAKRIGALAVGLWSLAMAMTGLAGSFMSLFATRLLLGVGEAPTFPIGYSALRAWAPKAERGLASAIFTAGISLGVAFGSLMGALLLGPLGWRSLFVFLGTAGFCWVAVWALVYSAPEKAAWLSTDERTHILATRDFGEAKRQKPAVRQLLSSPPAWGVITPQVCANYGNFLFLTWLPSFFAGARHEGVASAGVDTAICYGGAALVAMGLSASVDQIVARSGRAGARRIAVATSMLVAAVALFALRGAPAAWLTVIVGIALVGIQVALAHNQALASDLLIDGRAIGAFIGLIFTFSNGLGIAAPILTGLLVQHYNGFDVAFDFGGGVLVFGAIAAVGLARNKIDISGS